MQFIGVKEKEEKLKKLWSRLYLDSTDSYEIYFEEGVEFSASKKGTKLFVTYGNDSQLYRSLLICARLISCGEDKTVKEAEQFKKRGVMLDMSRAGVMNVEAVKEYIEYMALCGLNAAMLYMEDVFEVDGLPYFGYMRGRYTKEELKEIDRYGREFGVEMIPCIQTLGHFEQYIKWQEGKKISDTNTVLLAESEETYEFLEKLIKTMSECFETRAIHIGMDEAWGLGTGRYLEKNGYKSGTDILNDHIVKVMEITNKYNLEPMIWSDMYFRLASETGDYYDVNAKVPDYVADIIPPNLSLTYWDYYHTDPEFFRLMMTEHKKITDKILFAGGIWLWAGLLPDYKHSHKSTNAGLSVCKETGVNEVYATLWGDDGCETDAKFSLPGCVLYGEHSFNKEISEDELNEKTRLLFNADFSDFVDISDATYPGADYEFEKTNLCVKTIVYSDIMNGLADYDIAKDEFVVKYFEMAEKYRKLSCEDGYFKDHFKYVADVCKVAGLKCDVAVKLHKAYPADKKLLSEIAEDILPELQSAFEELKDSHYKLWFGTYRPFGFEIADGRYGMKIERIKTAKKRILSYLYGETEKLAELETERLPFVSEHSMPHWHSGSAYSFMPKGF